VLAVNRPGHPADVATMLAYLGFTVADDEFPRIVVLIVCANAFNCLHRTVTVALYSRGGISG